MSIWDSDTYENFDEICVHLDVRIELEILSLLVKKYYICFLNRVNER